MTRSHFLRVHIEEIMSIIRSDVPLIGYLHWSLFDNYEWGTFTPRFGLYSINYAKDNNRLVEDHLGDRPSATYAELIQLSREQTGEPAKTGELGKP
jgi:beta-glucosidase/6-phospho-beta-glucosidase/beta-galactosidase